MTFFKTIKTIFIFTTLTLSSLNSIFAEINPNNDYKLGYIDAIINQYSDMADYNAEIKGETLKITFSKNYLQRADYKKIQRKILELDYFKAVEIDIAQASNNKKITSSGQLFPSNALYPAPVADPRWPKFTAGYQRHHKRNYGKDFFVLGFGDNLPLSQYNYNVHLFELGIQAGLFGIMDVTKQKDTKLVNADYFVGLGLSHNYLNSHNLLQFYRQSSHLGDEFLLSEQGKKIKRINLSYESLRLLSSYPVGSFRPYIGVEYFVNVDPHYIKRWSYKLGLDFVSEKSFIYDSAKFIAGFNSNMWQQNKFKPSINIRAGLQFENPKWYGRKLQLTTEYSQGPSQHGQLYNFNEQTIGIILNLAS